MDFDQLLKLAAELEEMANTQRSGELPPFGKEFKIPVVDSSKYDKFTILALNFAEKCAKIQKMVGIVGNRVATLDRDKVGAVQNSLIVRMIAKESRDLQENFQKLLLEV